MDLTSIGLRGFYKPVERRWEQHISWGSGLRPSLERASSPSNASMIPRSLPTCLTPSARLNQSPEHPHPLPHPTASRWSGVPRCLVYSAVQYRAWMRPAPCTALYTRVVSSLFPDPKASESCMKHGFLELHEDDSFLRLSSVWVRSHDAT
jgi:hypothetical protein